MINICTSNFKFRKQHKINFGTVAEGYAWMPHACMNK